MKAKPKISVIIPVYNTEKYLSECLDSIVNQTLSDIEIICVDDGSPDYSIDILNKYAAKDERVRVVRHIENQGRHLARKTGVEAAQGEYILFMDSDDLYASNDALMRLYQEIKAQNVDMLQFGVNIVPEPCVPEREIAWCEKYFKPYKKRIDANPRELLEKALIEKQPTFNISDKIFKAEIVKKAYAELPDLYRIAHAEDMCAFFAIACFAQSFVGMDGLAFYNYRIGRGSYGKQIKTIRFFEGQCSRHRIIDALYSFLDKQNMQGKYEDILEKVDREFLLSTIYEWKNLLSGAGKKEVFDLMCKTWSPERVIAEMAESSWNERRAIAHSVRGAKCLERKAGKIKTIAMYYHWLTHGGLERVISLLASDWLNAGYRVIVITDMSPTDQDYALPEGVKRVEIPDWRKATGKYYGVRADALVRILKEHEVDLVDYHAWVSESLLWDTLVIKSQGVAVNYHTHNICVVGLGEANTSMADRYAIASLMDSVAVLSATDAEFYRCVNANVHYIANPLKEEEIARLPIAELKNKTVLLCARISKEKRTIHAIEVFAHVCKQVPDAKLIILGDGEEKIKKEMRRLITQNHLEDRVVCPGSVSDVQPYYLEAGVLILTSEFEGYSMVIQEALSYGVPVVTYRMDYLELIRQCPSIISVDQLDAQTMAEQIIRLLQDDEERKRIGAKARQEILEFARNSRVSEKWKELFASIEEGRRDTECDESQKILMDTIMEHMALGSKVKNQEMTQLKKAYADRERILSSRSYKLARLIGAPVRLLRRILK